MASFEKAVPTNERQLKKLRQQLREYGCDACYDDLIAQSRATDAVDFPKLRVLVTRDYVCSYEPMFRMLIIPLKDVTALYATNLPSKDEYSFDKLYLAVETESARYPIAAIPYGSKSKQQLQIELSALIKRRMTLACNA